MSTGELELRYHGWSDVEVRAPGGVPLVFDPAPDRALSDERAVFLVTHGHPEHVMGALAHLRRGPRARVTVVASAAICRYLERRTAGREDRFLSVAPGARVGAFGWRVRVFGWTHMSLLPPGIVPAVRYVGTLARNPRGLVRMARDALRGPAHAPMLGYHVRAGRRSIVYYGEGLHRRTTRTELAEAIGPEPIDALVFGAEPEDVEALPALLSRGGPGARAGIASEHGPAIERALVFQPHRAWREEFGLPQLDGAALIARLLDAGVDAASMRPGEPITVGATRPRAQLDR